MNKLLSFRFQNTALALLLLWLVASAFYYTEQLFSPNFYMGYDEGTLHKVIKYFACLSLSVYFCFAARAWGVLFFCTLLLLLAAFFVIDSGGLEVTAVSFLVTGTMAPFILIPKLFENRLLLIGRIIVICGAGVGIFSVIEMTLLAPIFESVWASTGSIRSISTLFNPNNLGLYVGVALVLLPNMKMKAIWASLCGALLIFSLVASGSRTAWVSLVVVLVYALIMSAKARARILNFVLRGLPQLILIGVILFGVYMISLMYSSPVEVETANRGADLYTASIRWDNFLKFLGSMDVSLVFPDMAGLRTEYIQDNFYLVVLNSFGVVGLLFFIAFFVVFFSPWRNTNSDVFPWRLVFIFYMVSGLSGSQLNSFPNNQMFFISMGSLWAYRVTMRRSRERHTADAPRAA